jgi:hypothetical protein
MKYWDGYDRLLKQFCKYQTRTVNIKQFFFFEDIIFFCQFTAKCRIDNRIFIWYLDKNNTIKLHFKDHLPAAGSANLKDFFPL